MAATAAVFVVPVAVAWGLRTAGVISSRWICLVLAVGLSLAASSAGNAYWRKRRSPGDLVFSELLLWGWLRRWRVERQLSSAIKMLGLTATGPVHGLNVERREQLLRTLAAALEAHDPYLDGHSRRVARHAVMIARKMGVSGKRLAQIRTAAAIHDVGKLHVPPEILNKADKLTESEFAAIKRHADEGAEMVACLEDSELTAIVRHHHERLDGSGYPAGLLGDQIPLGARIVAVADTFDAITSARAYRSAARHKQAIDVLVKESGTRLDAPAVRAFLRYYSGRKPLLLWALLSVTPQRALARGRASGRVPTVTSSTGLIATVTATLAIGAAAFMSPLGGRAPRSEAGLDQQGKLSVASAAVTPSVRRPGSRGNGARRRARPGNRGARVAHGRGAVVPAAQRTLGGSPGSGSNAGAIPLTGSTGTSPTALSGSRSSGTPSSPPGVSSGGSAATGSGGSGGAGGAGGSGGTGGTGGSGGGTRGRPGPSAGHGEVLGGPGKSGASGAGNSGLAPGASH